MGQIHFTIEGVPPPLIRHRDMYDRHGEPVMRRSKGGVSYNPKRDPSKKDKQNFLIESLNYRPSQPIDSPVVLACIFWMPLLKKDSEDLKAIVGMNDRRMKAIPLDPIDLILNEIKAMRNGVPSVLTHQGNPDSANLLKFVEDALEGRFWVNDNQIQPLVWKFYTTNPRTELEILW